jgi:hypothetical protein
MAVRAFVIAPEIVVAGSMIGAFHLGRLIEATPHPACCPQTIHLGMTT